MATTPAEMAKQYEDYDLDHLFGAIGQRAEAAGTDPAATIVAPDEWSTQYRHLTVGDEAIKLGKRIARRLLGELHEVLCGNDPEDEADRNKLRDSLGLGRDALIGAIAAFLAGPLGIAAAIAAAVAAIFVKKIVEPSWEETCKFWDEKLAEI
jgi:hypothetical protein